MQRRDIRMLEASLHPDLALESPMQLRGVLPVRWQDLHGIQSVQPMAHLVDLAHASAAKKAYDFIVANGVADLKRHCELEYQDYWSQRAGDEDWRRATAVVRMGDTIGDKGAVRDHAVIRRAVPFHDANACGAAGPRRAWRLVRMMRPIFPRRSARRARKSKCAKRGRKWPAKDQRQSWCLARSRTRQRAYREDTDPRNCRPTIVKGLPSTESTG